MRKPLLMVAVVVVLFALTACKKPKLEGKILGFKPGSTSTVMVNAKATKGSRVWCAEGGHACEPFDMPASGEKDFEVDLSKGDSKTPNKVMLTATYQNKNNESIALDLLSALPPALEVSSFGFISCKPRECAGSIDVIASSAQLSLPAGSTFELGTNKFTADASGQAKGPVVLKPAFKDLALSTLCGSEKPTLGTMPASLTFPDKVKATTTFAISLEQPKAQLLVMLEGVKKGPVPFPWEPGAPGKGKAALLMKSSSCYAGGPSDATLKDVRVVLYGQYKPRTSTCNYAFDDGTKGVANLSLNDELATAYDRTTGRMLDTKLFEAKKFCSPEVTSKNKSLKAQSNYADWKAIAAWGATLAK